MKLVRLASAISVILLLSGIASAEDDVEGSKDPSYITRMPNFTISLYEQKDFDSYQFEMGETSTTIEGHTYSIEYQLSEGAKAPGELQIMRNYINAVKKLAGGSVVFEDQGGKRAIMRIAKNGKEAWVEVKSQDGAQAYTLTIVEKQEMAQDVTANDMFDALNRDGRVALYINFDTGKSTVRPESRKIIDQIVEMMKNNSGLRISVEGHTDSVGERAKNKILSEERAKAVVAALVKQGIKPTRLSAYGFGQEKPLADNKTEEGRAKNRRVELIKM